MKPNGRAHIKTITLANWRGIPFQVLEMDPYLTALEGKNGAGKTTVMTAFYLAIMPDVSRVKILNVGDTEDSGRESSLHGKLEPDVECYTILELVNPRGERIIAGVQLIPRSAPTVEVGGLFVIKGLRNEVAIEKVLIVEEGEQFTISNLSTIQNQVGVYGGTCELFKTISQYGDELFKQGILPINLKDKRARRNFNKLLHTSFQGGFSQHLQERLKDYLLGEDSKIGESVARMQANLTQARRTRALLNSLGKKIASIEVVQSSSLKMTNAAIAAVKLKDADKSKAFAALWQEYDQAKTTLLTYKKAEKKFKEEQKGVDGKIEAQQKAVAKAAEHLDTAQKALILAEKLVGLDAEFEKAKAALEDIVCAKDAAQVRHDGASEQLKLLQRQRESIAHSLSDAEQAWKTISREAGLYKAAVESLEKAQGSLPELEVSPENAQHLSATCDEKIATITSNYGTLERKLAAAKDGEAAFRSASAVLAEITQEQPPDAEAYALALATDRQYVDYERLVAENKNIGDKITKTRGKAETQTTLQQEVAGLKSLAIHVKSAAAFKENHQRITNELSEIDAAEKFANNELVTFNHALNADQIQATLCRQECEKFNKTLALRDRLAKKFLADFAGRQEVAEHIDQEETAREKSSRVLARVEHALEIVGANISDLASNKTSIDLKYENIAKTLGGKLVASLYEDIELSEACEKEARLGPLVNAIMVEDVQEAIAKLDAIKSAPDEVWLVQKGNLDKELFRLKKLSGAIAAEMGLAWRVTQIPKFAKIGVESRRKRMASLKAQQTELREQVELGALSLKVSSEGIEELKELLQGFHTLEGDNPNERLTEIISQISSRRHKIAEEETKKKELELSRLEWLPIKAVLDKWLSSSHLLDEESYADEVLRLVALKSEVENTREKIQKNRAALVALRQQLNDLKILPMSPAELSHQEGELSLLKVQWEFWDTALRHVKSLLDKITDFDFKESFVQRQKQEDPAAALRQKSLEAVAAVEAMVAQETACREALNASVESYNLAHSAFSTVSAVRAQMRKELAALGVDGAPKTLTAARASHGLSEALAKEHAAQKLKIDGGLLALATDICSCIGKCADLKAKRSNMLLSFRIIRKALQHTQACINHDQTLSAQWAQLTEIQEKYIDADKATGEAGKIVGILIGHFNTGMDGVADEFQAEELINSLNGVKYTCPQGEEMQYIRGYLDLWTKTVTYISQILPRDIVQTDDPVEAAQQMQARYTRLSSTLKAQESDFRSDSKDVSNSIRGRINEESRKVTSVNKSLDGISFGNIASIKIDFIRNEGTLSLLDAMRDQPDLFSENLPLPDIMRKIYEKITGGKTKGDDLLDYRKYISLNIKVLRKSTQKWEPGSGLSTGEAIGTGAAILMVILNAWEDTASFFKDKDLRNSMRFLFMDEATRLDPESIRTLLEFCVKMNIQLLIAGPKFEEEECGSGITYRLARKNFEGREEVVIRGRKGFGGNFLTELAS